MAKSALKTKEVSNDGYMDVVKSIGTTKKKGGKDFAPENVDIRKIASIYRFDGIGKNICNCVAEDGCAPGFEIDGDTDGKILKEVLKSGIRKAYKKAAKWTRAFGGALVVKKIADDRKLEQEAGKGKIVGFNVYPASQVSVSVDDYDKDQQSLTYGEPLWYTVSLRNVGNVRVHRSRCEAFYGEEVTCVDGMESSMSQSELLFGDSALVPVIGRLEKLGMSEEGIAELMSKVNVEWYQWDGYDQKLAMKNGMELVTKRMEAVQAGKSICNAIISDTKDKYSSIHSDLGGVPETMYRQMQMLVAAAELPVAKIFGESSSGLSTTGEGNREMYDKKVSTWMEDHVTEPVEHLVNDIIVRNLEGEGDVSITWNSVTQPNDEKFTNMAKTQSEYIHTYINDGVITPAEARQIVFINGHTFRLSLPEKKSGDDDDGE